MLCGYYSIYYIEDYGSMTTLFRYYLGKGFDKVKDCFAQKMFYEGGQKSEYREEHQGKIKFFVEVWEKNANIKMRNN